MGEPVRVAIVGAGMAARQHAEALAQVDGADLVAVSEPCGEAPEWVPRPFVTPIGAIWTDPAIDVVAFCTPPGARGPLLVEALRHGKAVVVEKPAAPTLAAFDQLVAMSEASGLPVAVMHQHRFALSDEAWRTPWSGRAVGVVEVYKPRPAAYFEASPWRTAPRLAGGGALAHLGSHYLDLACLLLGAPETVAAVGTAYAPGIETAAAAAVRFASGATLSVACSCRPASRHMRLSVRDDDHSLTLADGAETWVDAGAPPRHVGPSPIPTLRAQVYAEVRDAVRQGRRSLGRSDLALGRGALVVLEAVREAVSGPPL